VTPCLFIVIEGGSEADPIAAGPRRHGASPRDAVTSAHQPKLTPFVSVTYIGTYNVGVKSRLDSIFVHLLNA